ncbi:MAG: hypothetical protein Tsb0020_47900 [Haliangiales bacterium]
MPLQDIERQLATHCERGEYDAATTLAIQHYGSEVMGYLASTVRAWHEAADIFAICSEDLWNALPAFQWRCTVRTYFYTLARNARSRFFNAQRARGARRGVPLSQAPQIERAVAHVRTTTPRYRQTAEKAHLARLRQSLDSFDRDLLLLRVDRQLSWPEIAAIVQPETAEMSEAEQTREAAKLRKRFERIKKRLRQLRAAERADEQPGGEN